ncbi:MAG: hypothetical protein EAZ55_06870 [Cytophagales bacterium]|nr:MAG: hypothetical protein EAZ55_06870 [Cytophagales bacterium]
MFWAYTFYYFGWIAVIVGVISAIKLYRKYDKEKKYVKKMEKKKWEDELAFMDKSVYEQLELLKRGNLVIFWDRNYETVGKMRLVEMTWEGDNHIATGRYFPIITLDNNRLLVSMPRGEGQSIIWFMFEQVHCDTALTPFFAGTDEKPGPAMVFADSEQTAEVLFELPQNATEHTLAQGQWKMKDIGSFNFKADEYSFVKGNGEMRHVLARHHTQEKQYLLYFDLQAGEGSDTLLLGTEIDPSTEIKYVFQTDRVE